jgi:predicted transposase/invertase (TIGR01784 family)
MAYLDPKNDLTFKKVFGEHPDLLKSFLNALLPLGDHLIESLEYLPAELVPEIPLLKHTIVDVRCRDTNGRQFIVETQMFWTESFKARVVFNASKAYVKQLDKARQYASLQPVYALSLVNDVFSKEEQYYHHYQIVNLEDTGQQLEGLEFVFVELPKFKPQSLTDRRMQVLWLRFLTEVKDGSEAVPEDLFDNEEIKKALDTVSESAFSKAELESYDRYWDSILSERTLHEELSAKALQRGMEQGLEKGMEQGMERGKKLQALGTALKAIKKGMPKEDVQEITSLSSKSIAAVQDLLVQYGDEAESHLPTLV